jgi:serine/threonine-protein kinase
MDEERLGHYELKRCLGEGGMGRVYLARDTQLERDVALKVIAPELVGNRDLLARFRVEAVAQARLNHANIVTIHAFGQEAGSYVIVMEYVAGRTLKQILREQGRLGTDAALRIAGSVLDALAFAHAKGVLHRDIKPANIFVTDDGTVKLGDFGIAKVEGVDGLTRVGTMVGTPHYSSPEQIRALKVKPASDIYSLSVTLFEMLTGVLPFGTPGSSDLEIRNAHLQRTAPVLSSLCPGLPPRLDAILARGLAKKPEDRFVSAQDYRQALSGVSQPRPSSQLPRLPQLPQFPQVRVPDFRKALEPLARIPAMIRELPSSGVRWWLLIPLIPLLLLLLVLMMGCAAAPDAGLFDSRME